MTLSELKSLSIDDRFTAFVKWLGEQPADVPYNYHDWRGYALCMFGKGLGLREVSAGTSYLRNRDDPSWPEVDIIPCGRVTTIVIVAMVSSKTLGELYLRLLPHLSEPVALSDACLDALELRPLVGIDERRVLS